MEDCVSLCTITQTNCTVVNAGDYYSLSPLTRASENYVIPLGIKNKFLKSPKIILHVCQSILYGIMYPIKSGACLDDPKQSNRSTSRFYIKINYNVNIISI